jgi:hypothetical protein
MKAAAMADFFETGISDTSNMLRHEAAPLLLKALYR